MSTVFTEVTDDQDMVREADRQLRENHGITMSDAAYIIAVIGCDGFTRVRLAAELNGWRLCNVDIRPKSDGTCQMIHHQHALPPSKPPKSAIEEYGDNLRRLKRSLDRKRRRESGFGR